MIARRAHDRAHSLKTRLPLNESSSPETKHCSALSQSAVRTNDSRYRLSVSSWKMRQKSPMLAYGVGPVMCFASCTFTSVSTPALSSLQVVSARASLECHRGKTSHPPSSDRGSRVL